MNPRVWKPRYVQQTKPPPTWPTACCQAATTATLSKQLPGFGQAPPHPADRPSQWAREFLLSQKAKV
jgi:hypothetical protein